MSSSLSFSERRLKRGTASISDSNVRFMFSVILCLYRNSGRRKWELVPANEAIITDFTHVDKKCFNLFLVERFYGNAPETACRFLAFSTSCCIIVAA
jgi:hypothetical protein